MGGGGGVRNTEIGVAVRRSGWGCRNPTAMRIWLPPILLYVNIYLQRLLYIPYTDTSNWR